MRFVLTTVASWAAGLAIALACGAPSQARGVVARDAAPATLDAAFARYWAAKDPGDAAKAANDIVKSGASFDEVYRRLKTGRTYAKNVPTGIVRARRGEFSYTLDVPPTYDASRQYQVRFQLHGAVAAPREASERRGLNGIGRLAGGEQIYVLPAGWNEAPWWSDAQVVNLRAILDTLKRTYNIDENHVVVSGVSDGGTGAYFVAMRDTTPYAAFLPLNGYLLVLPHVTETLDADLCPNNLRNKPFFVVNGGRDPLYPMAAVQPSLEHMARGGVQIVYKPQPQAGHDTSWWPEVKESFEAFVRDHPRAPLPDRLTWETSETHRFARAHWLEINALGGRSDAAGMTDINDVSPPPEASGSSDRRNRDARPRQLFRRTGRSGRVDVTRAGNVIEATSRGVTQFTLLCSPDQFTFDQPVRVDVNGHAAFEGRIEKSVATLMKWAARDNDRTMLFGAEIKITVK